MRISEAVTWRCSAQNMFLKISQNLQKSTLFLIKLQASGLLCSFIEKETLAQVFSHEFC